MADLLSTRLTEGPPGSLLLDVGTNTELALWDGTRLHVTAVPGGPAFEGAGLRNGMAAEAGAICRVKADMQFNTVAGAPVRGFCGSGLVDAVAMLLATGQIKPSGRFAAPPGSDGYRLDPANPRTALFSQDIDIFQRAKAATAAAMMTLLHNAGMDWSDVSRLCVCGAFGRRLSIAHAQAVGLLPPLDPERIELFAEASLAGAEMGLLNHEVASSFAFLHDRVEVINLAQAPGYEDRYIDHLRLQPMSWSGSTQGG